MTPVLSEILRSGFMINSSLRRRTHLVQSFSVVFLYWFYVFSECIYILMATSSGNSSMTTKLQSSGSEEDLQLLMDQRKRKRKQSNRESAKRSRMRKQKHLDDLIAQVDMLKKENSEILTRVNITTQHYLKVEAENCILRAQMGELSQRLQSLNDILELINTNNGVCDEIDTNNCCYLTGASDYNFMNPMNMIHLNQPIMASADMFQW
ncbi:hypothetical protein RIF29_06168 [Crotalaria pallida]|uniref:BZIP domain-containing protein n=1 Tax=Crotalaria pallida TaxID=3830 RepID=A0AAN9PB43_CROPI